MTRARAAGCAWCSVPEAGRAGGYTHLRVYGEFMDLRGAYTDFNGMAERHVGVPAKKMRGVTTRKESYFCVKIHGSFRTNEFQLVQKLF